MKLLAKLLCYFTIFSITLNTVSNAFAEDEPAPQEKIWNETQELLQRREYALAVNILENGLDDAELFSHTKRIQEDLDAVKLLKKFSDTVDYSVERLPASKSLTVLSKKHLFKSVTNGNSGKIIVLTDPRGDDVTYPINRLDSATWLEMAEPELRNWSEKDFVTGLFLAFDRYPNARLARTKLNAAAENGQNVAVWIKRLEDAEQQRKLKSRPDADEPLASELILGNWSVAGSKSRQVWELRSGGVGKVRLLNRKIVAPAKWSEESPGVFRLTFLDNTAVVNVSGDRVFGRYADGEVFKGIRQAK